MRSIKVLLVVLVIVNVCLIALVLNTRQDRQTAFGQVAMRTDRFLAVTGDSPFDEQYLYVIDNRNPRVAVFVYNQQRNALALMDNRSLVDVFGDSN